MWVGNPFLEQFQNKDPLFKEDYLDENEDNIIPFDEYIQETYQNYINYHYCLIEPYDFEEHLPENYADEQEEEINNNDEEEIDEDWLEYEMYLMDEKFRY